MALPDHDLGVGHHRERAEPQEVELDQPDLLDAVHVVLGHHVAGLRIAIQRHKLDEGPIADHHPGCVLRGMTRQALQAQRRLDQLLDLSVRVDARAQLGRLGDRVRERDAEHLRDELRHGIDVAEGHPQHPTDVADGGPGLQGPEGHDLGDGHLVVAAFDVLAVVRGPAGAVLVGHVANHLVATAHAEVDVDVRHRHTLGVQEALEDDPVVDRVDAGDSHPVGDETAGRGAAPRTHRDAVALRVVDEIRDDQEVARVAHLPDDLELVLHAIGVLGVPDGLVRGEVHALP